VSLRRHQQLRRPGQIGAQSGDPLVFNPNDAVLDDFVAVEYPGVPYLEPRHADALSDRRCLALQVQSACDGTVSGKNTKGPPGKSPVVIVIAVMRGFDALAHDEPSLIGNVVGSRAGCGWRSPSRCS
jgi:hypothetical protein